MQIHLLAQANCPPVPDDVTVLQNWGTVVIMNHVTSRTEVGDHIMVEGTPEAIKKWLSPLNGFWLGKGIPMLQQFEIAHTKD